jgi:hypothetical protein
MDVQWSCAVRVSPADRIHIIQRRSPGAAAQLMPAPGVQLGSGDELLIQGTPETLAALRRA